MNEQRGNRWGIAELAEQTGVTPRTVRYYVAEGLLPPPGGAGQQRVYTDEHLRRLQAIKRLKEAYLPLDEIRRQLAMLPAEELERLIEVPQPAPGSALDYIAAVLASPSGPKVAREAPAGLPRLVAQSSRETASAMPTSATAPMAAIPAVLETTAWRRAVLAPGVELHYQLSGDPRREVAIMQVIQQAAGLLANIAPPDQPRR